MMTPQSTAAINLIMVGQGNNRGKMYILSRTFPGQKNPGQFQDILQLFEIPVHFQDVLKFQDAVGTLLICM
jgi:hypothetical protein